MTADNAGSEEKLYWNPAKPWGYELVVNTLVEQGVEIIFSLTGGHVAALLKAAEDRGIKVVGTHTEEAAVLAAIGYAMSSGKVGVVCITAGMVSYAHAAMLTATLGQAPVVVIAGASESFADGMRQLQEIDQKPIAQSALVKEALHCTKWERIPNMLTWAFKTAQGPVPGCAFVDFPVDILSSQGDPAGLEKFATCVVQARSAGDPALIEKAVQMLLKAEKPIISVGRLAVAANAGPEIKEFVELTGIPVETCIGTVGSHALNIGFQICNDADVALVLGKMSQGIEGSLNANSFCGQVIAVYPDPADIGRCYPVALGIAGDVKLVMRQMIAEAKKYKFGDYTEWVQDLIGRREGTREQFNAIAEEAVNRVPVHPTVLTKAAVDWIADHKLNKEAIMSADGGDSIYWWFMFFGASGMPMEFSNQIAGAASLQLTLGSVGMGLALGIGSACAHPDKIFIMPTAGDGALGYHLAEFETLARLNVPAVIVVHNNNSWGMVYADQRRIWGKQARSGSFFSENIHYEKVAEALGCVAGEFVTRSDEIRPALDRALERARQAKKPVVVNVITDPNAYIVPWPWWVLPESPEGEPYEGMGY